VNSARKKWAIPESPPNTIDSVLMTPVQKQLAADLVMSAPTAEPLDLAIGLIMNRLLCSQGAAFAELRDLRPVIAAVSEVPFMGTQLRVSGVPQGRWKWMFI
jgi:hypothetical protein